MLLFSFIMLVVFVVLSSVVGVCVSCVSFVFLSCVLCWSDCFLLSIASFVFLCVLEIMSAMLQTI